MMTTTHNYNNHYYYIDNNDNTIRNWREHSEHMTSPALGGLVGSRQMLLHMQ